MLNHHNSLDRGQPFTVQRELSEIDFIFLTYISLVVGAGRVIKGWDEGLQGMCVKEKRTLTIPPDMAYGSSLRRLTTRRHTDHHPGPRGFGNVIPPNSVLVFDVELVGLESAPSHKEL